MADSSEISIERAAVRNGLLPIKRLRGTRISRIHQVAAALAFLLVVGERSALNSKPMIAGLFSGPSTVAVKKSKIDELRSGVESLGHVGRDAAVNASLTVSSLVHDGMPTLQRLPSTFTTIVGQTSAELKKACWQAGGREIVIGAAASGGVAGLCVSAILWTGDEHSKNMPGIAHGKRRRLIAATLATAGLAAYLSSLPIHGEDGGTHQFAEASAFTRRLGRSVAFAVAQWDEPLPIQKRKKKSFFR